MKTLKQITTILILSIITLTSLNAQSLSKQQESKILNASAEILINAAKPFYKKGMTEQEFINSSLGNVKIKDRKASLLLHEIYSVASGNKTHFNTTILKDIARSKKPIDELIQPMDKKWNWKKFFKVLKLVIDIIVVFL